MKVKYGAYEFDLKPNKANSLYQIDEKVIFNLDAKLNGKAIENLDISWVLTKDGVPQKNGEAKIINGSHTLETKFESPSFIQCTIIANIKEKGVDKPITIISGVACNPEKIKSSMASPQDFDQYWQKQKDILKNIPINLTLNELKTQEGIAQYKITADSFNAKLKGYLAFPANAKDKSLAGILLLDTSEKELSHIELSKHYAKKGYIALAINANYVDTSEKIKDTNPIKSIINKDELLFRTLYIRLMRAMDIIIENPKWDTQTLVAWGGSQGGAQAIVAAALYNDKVSFYLSHVPLYCDLTSPIAKKSAGWINYINFDKIPNKEKTLKNIRYFDCVNFASKIKCEGVVSVGFADTMCTPNGIYAMYNKINAPKTILNMKDCNHTPSSEYYKVAETLLNKHIQSKNKN